MNKLFANNNAARIQGQILSLKDSPRNKFKLDANTRQKKKKPLEFLAQKALNKFVTFRRVQSILLGINPSMKNVFFEGDK